MDLTAEERTQGKTVEVGQGFFETSAKRYTILDAPGHKMYTPSMIGGASQADVGILVISARRGEYETGFERGGQTREHAMLAKTQGVDRLVVAANKMDDPTVQWSEARFNECTRDLGQFLRGLGYNLRDHVLFLPVAAQSLANVNERVGADVCSWWYGCSLLEYLDSMQTIERKTAEPLMMPVAAKYLDLGTIVQGKIESGTISKSDTLIMMPNKHTVQVAAIFTSTDDDEVPVARCGDNTRLRLRGIDRDDVHAGFVLCSPSRLVHCVPAFEAQIRILDLPKGGIVTAGTIMAMHVHTAVRSVSVSALLHTLQKGTGRRSKRPPTFVKRGDDVLVRFDVVGDGFVCVERYSDYQQMGRFTLRDQGQTIAIGKITDLIFGE